MEHFLSPGPNSQYNTGDTISFLVDDMPDEDNQNINANLHKSDGSFVKTLQTWNSQDVDENGEEFPFQWSVDVTEGGLYYVEIKVGMSMEDVIQSYPFQVSCGGASCTDSITPASSQPDTEFVQEMDPIMPNDSTVADPNTQSSELDDASPKLPIPEKEESTKPTLPSPSMQDLEAADNVAVAQEKASIAQQQQNKVPARKQTADKDQQVGKTSRPISAVEIAKKVKAAAAINKAASIAHGLTKQKRNAYHHIQRNRAKFSKWN
ncbi:hypothetical protein [Absidia glauca]|uniref:Uncharacterized protein n=1 Tax=Absidia glauca TaxID=4829 RepID=A0A168NAY4_ABSGL|nr:hypothetical protein [Absidia glauca]